MVKICAIVAMDAKRVIGDGVQIPWHLPEDLKLFSKLTTGHTVLMGRKTFDSLPARFKPLPNRKNIVASKSSSSILEHPEVTVCVDALDFVCKVKNGEIKLVSDILWVIGGEAIYRATLSKWDEVYLTKVDGTHKGEVKFPEFEDDFIETNKTPGNGFEFSCYKRK
jgi:dihydrofolate reductase